MSESRTVSIASRRGEPWTIDEELLLATSLADGQSLSTIAKLLGRCQGAVHCKALHIEAVKKRPRTRRGSGTPRRRVSDFFLS